MNNSQFRDRLVKLPGFLRSALLRDKQRGACIVCGQRTLFVNISDWPREHCRCIRCGSSARGRALMHVLGRAAPDWRHLRLLEFAPHGPVSKKLESECEHYRASVFGPGLTPGSDLDGRRVEDLRAMSLPDECLDIIVSQDVLEHVIGPAAAFAEIARVLVPGGVHVFTVPIHGDNPSVTRVEFVDGIEAYFEEPEYHEDPGSSDGVLVATDWGPDIVDFISAHSGMETEIVSLHDPGQGLSGGHLQVLVSRKPGFQVAARSGDGG